MTQLKPLTHALILALLLSALAISVSGANDLKLPPGLQKAKQYEEKSATEFVQKVSFLIAFLAGVTTLLSPCILPVLPAFFAYTFKEKKRITLMTLVFFAGFTVTFVTLGVVAATAGQLLASLIEQINVFVTIAGVLLVLLGVMYFFGKDFRLVKVERRQSNDVPGVFVAGLLFGLGWVVCTGPVLSGILTMAAVLRNYLTATILMVSYSLGVFMPLFAFSFFYDKYDLGRKKWLRGKNFKLKAFGKETTINSNQAIAGMLLIIIGLVFIIFKGTWIVNGYSFFGLKQYFYSLQNVIINNPAASSIIGAALLAVLAYGSWRFAFKKR